MMLLYCSTEGLGHETERYSFTARTDDISPLDDLDASRENLYDLLVAHVTGWDPRDLHDLAHVFMVQICTLTYTFPAQHLRVADT